jgi:DNA-binding response OmpR family regulator
MMLRMGFADPPQLLGHTIAWPEPTCDQPQPRATPSLVLFVGGTRPESACQEELARAGMRCAWVASLPQAQRAVAAVRADALVLHLSGPLSESLPEVVRWRVDHGHPMLLLSERADGYDEVMALEAGADAYRGLPIAPRPLRAQLMALLRRAAPAAPAASPEIPSLPLSTPSLRAASGPLRRLLQALVAARGEPVPRAALMRLACGVPSASDGSRAIDTQICRLRKALRRDGQPFALKAVRGLGYRLECLWHR